MKIEYCDQGRACIQVNDLGSLSSTAQLLTSSAVTSAMASGTVGAAPPLSAPLTDIVLRCASKPPIP